MTVLRPMGLQAVLVTELPDPAGWALALRALAPNGLVDVVPAAETVLVTCDSPAALAALEPVLHRVEPRAATGQGGALVEIPVRYDGADLAEVAHAAGLTVAGVIEAHSQTEYTAAFCGFAPGWAYLVGIDARLVLPRRDTPRPRVPAGSVAIATTYTGVYPRESPGGWHLLGTTDVNLFDPAAATPSLINPGDRVRFVPR